MHGIRLTILLMIFASAIVLSAGLRVEQRRCLVQIQQCRLGIQRLKTTVHKQQLDIARLRSPGQLHRRLHLQDICVSAPWEDNLDERFLDDRVVASSTGWKVTRIERQE